jgi:hypothetical protein
MLPIFGDQWPNARAMEGRKVGVQVARDEDDGSFDRHGIAGAVRAVMLEEESREVFICNQCPEDAGDCSRSGTPGEVH